MSGKPGTNRLEEKPRETGATLACLVHTKKDLSLLKMPCLIRQKFKALKSIVISLVHILVLKSFKLVFKSLDA